MEHISKYQEKKFINNKGMSTKFWGPRLWDSLFTMILGQYPFEIDDNNPEHKKIKRAFVFTLSNLKYTLPCSFCRLSYKTFFKQLPIEPFTNSRINMMYWLYLIKDKVNKKLIKQELEYLNGLYKKYKENKISKPEYLNSNNKCFITLPSPPFIDILEKYEKNRAVCNKKLKKCISKN